MPIRVFEPAPPGTDSTAAAAQEGAPVSAATLSVVFGRGLRLEIGEGFNAEALRRVLEVLGRVG